MNVLLIDNNVKEYEIVIQSCNSNTYPIVYSSNSTKNTIIEDISNNIINQINRIGIFADQVATLFLDKPFFLESDLNDSIDSIDLNNYSDNVNFIISLIKKYNISYIDFFACNSLNSPKWVKYYQLLMSLTNVLVGASNNATGNIQYGGDWIMESTCEDIEFIYFTKNIEYYKYLLISEVGNFYILNSNGTITNITTFFDLYPSNSEALKTKVNTKMFSTTLSTSDLNKQYRIKDNSATTFTNPPPINTGFYLNYTGTGSEIVTGTTVSPPYYDIGCFYTIAPTIVQFTRRNVAPYITVGTTTTLNSTNNSNLIFNSIEDLSSLYTYNTESITTSVTEEFELLNGSINCYVVLIGPGGWGTSSTASTYRGGAGGGGAIASFTMVKNEKYTITLNPGTNDTTNGTTIQGSVSISNSTRGMNITATGGNITSSALPISGGTGTVTGTDATFIQKATYNGGNSHGTTSSGGNSHMFYSGQNGFLISSLVVSGGIQSIVSKSNQYYGITMYNYYTTYYTALGYDGSPFYEYSPTSLVVTTATGIYYAPGTNGFGGAGGGIINTQTYMGATFNKKGFRRYQGSVSTSITGNNNALGYGSGGSVGYTGSFRYRINKPLPPFVSSFFTEGGKGGAGAVMIYLNATQTL